MSHRIVFACALILFSIGAGRDRFDDWVDETHLPPLRFATSQEIVDRDGHLLRVFPVENGIIRMTTTPRDVDPSYVALLIAVEDKRFWSHSGVDPVALLRAGGQLVWNRRVVSGASTLTMQTARLIENSGTGGWTGKLRQIRVALALERRLSKEEILTLYLTHAPFGGRIEGVRAASLAWFGKPPHRLSPDEAALLVALPQAPTARRPDRHPKVALAARDRILSNQNLAAGLETLPDRLQELPQIAPHLTNLAKRSDPSSSVMSLTVQRDLQEQLENLAIRTVAGLPEEVSAAILVADHETGELLGYVGSPDYRDARRDGFVDMVTAVRSPGSTLKPLIYGLAFDQGLAHPETVIRDTPVAFGRYRPQNFDGVFRGEVTIRQALEESLNIPPLLLTNAMGPTRLIAGLKRSGADPKLPSDRAGLAVALGGVGLSLKELVQLYAGLARGGESVKLHWRREQQPATRKIMSERSAWQVGHMLAGIQPPQGQRRGQIAFKTGTSYGHRDAWAIGWDGQYVAGVWLGRPDGTPVPGIFGGDIAAPVLFEVFDRIAPMPAPLPLPPKDTLLLSNALLPVPLQRFSRIAEEKQDALRFDFPPNGARLKLMSDMGLTIKLDGGDAPFAILSNDKPVAVNLQHREFELSNLDRGFTRLTVLDAGGARADIDVRLD